MGKKFKIGDRVKVDTRANIIQNPTKPFMFGTVIYIEKDYMNHGLDWILVAFDDWNEGHMGYNSHIDEETYKKYHVEMNSCYFIEDTNSCISKIDEYPIGTKIVLTENIDTIDFNGLKKKCNRNCYFNTYNARL